MKRLLFFTLLLAAGVLPAVNAFSAPLDPRDYAAPVRVACVGDSITAGAGAGPGQAWPEQLQRLLGGNWEVRNFGVSGRTLLRKGDFPYWKEPAFGQAQSFQPDAVVILLGANDTKPQNWAHRGEFVADYRDLVNVFRGLPSRPRVFVCRPTPVPEPGAFGINEAGVKEEIKLIDALAAEMKLDEIDLHAALEGKPELLPDHVHPNAGGAAEIAGAVRKALAGQKVSTGAKDGKRRALLQPLAASDKPRTLTVTASPFRTDAD